MARILITGAHGFIGKHLARHLTAKGHQVSGLGHGIWLESEASSWGVTDWVNGDVCLGNLRALQAQLQPDVVFHLAGGATVSAAIANPREDFLRTVASTIELLEWIRLDLPKARLIAVSSAAIYGSGNHGPIKEDIDRVPYSPYGYHKHIMELLCHSYGETYGLDFRVARLFSVYGPQLKKQLLWEICTRLAVGESPIVLGGTGQELRDWIHVKDVVAALELISFDTSPALSGQSINIGTGVGTPVRIIAQILIDAWQQSSNIREKPVLHFSGESRRGDPFSLVADPTRLMRTGFSWNVPLVVGVESFVDWFRFYSAQ